MRAQVLGLGRDRVVLQLHSLRFHKRRSGFRLEQLTASLPHATCVMRIITLLGKHAVGASPSQSDEYTVV